MFVLIIIMVIIAAYQIPVLLRRKDLGYRELIAFLILWFISGLYAILVIMEVPVVSPFTLITKIVSKIINMVDVYLMVI